MEQNPFVPSLYHPQLLVTDPETQQSAKLRMTELSIEINVLGSLASTTLEVVFHNGYDEILEGELRLPLNEGQTITRYALDINGKMREGVVVAKDQARKAFEEIVRRQVDPGLVEKVRGNEFKTRVYPLPALGSRRFRMGFEQALTATPEGFLYELPLQFTDALDLFRLRVNVFDEKTAPQVAGKNWANLSFATQQGIHLAEREFTQYRAEQPLKILVPREPDAPAVSVEKGEDGHTYFHIQCVPEQFLEPRKTPTHIGLYWDVSASAQKRNFKQELELLDAWFQEIENFRLDLIPFSYALHPSTTIHVQGGDWSELRHLLMEMVYDGGTQLGNLDFDQFQGDEIVIFTDGLQTYGGGQCKMGDTPVIIINSAVTAHHAHLKSIAATNDGDYLNLFRIGVEAALTRLRHKPYRFLYAEMEQVEEVYPARATAIDKTFTLAGRVLQPNQSITLHFGTGSTSQWSQTFQLPDLVKGNQGSGLVRRMWAGMKLAELESASSPNREAIIAHGKAHQLVTDYTSLLVLEEIRDYVNHGITPPEELKKAYANYQKSKMYYMANIAVPKLTEDERIDLLIWKYRREKRWWRSRFPKRNTQPKLPPYVNYWDWENTWQEKYRFRLRAWWLRVTKPKDGKYYYEFGEDDITLSSEEALAQAEEGLKDTDLSEPNVSYYVHPGDSVLMLREDCDDETPSSGVGAQFNIDNWDPDEPYLPLLESTADPYETYLGLRAQ